MLSLLLVYIRVGVAPREVSCKCVFFASCAYKGRDCSSRGEKHVYFLTFGACKCWGYASKGEL